MDINNIFANEKKHVQDKKFRFIHYIYIIFIDVYIYIYIYTLCNARTFEDLAQKQQ